jgi:hypothetical protein
VTEKERILFFQYYFFLFWFSNYMHAYSRTNITSCGRTSRGKTFFLGYVRHIHGITSSQALESVVVVTVVVLVGVPMAM